MTKYVLALTVALVALPGGAFAQTGDTTTAPAPISAAQRQALQALRQKAMQMHDQLRTQILDALSPDHRTAVANAIGSMVISPSPDPAATAKQIDGLLSPEEQQRIVAAHDAFMKQMQAMAQQFRSQFAHQGPSTAAHWTGAQHPIPMPSMNDAGNVVLMVLAHHPPMMPMMDRGGMPMGPPGGQPPNGPPGGPPPPR